MAALSFAFAQGGPPPGGRPPGGPGFGGRGGPGMERGLPPIEMLVFRRDVQEDIQLTDGQRDKLDGLRETMRPPGGRGFGGPGGPGGPPPGGPGFGGQGGPPPPGGPDGQRRPGGRQDERRKKNEAAIKAILTSDQFGRVKQIGIQLAGIHAILDKGVQDQLGLSDGQKTKLAELVKAQQAAMRAQFEKMREDGPGDPEQMRATMDQNRKAFDAKLKSVLTGGQASQLNALGGKPFNATQDDRFGGPPPPPGGGGE